MRLIPDTTVVDGSVVLIPWDTNAQWKHGVRHLVRFEDRRISLTVRAFYDAVATFQGRPVLDLRGLPSAELVPARRAAPTCYRRLGLPLADA